MIAADDTTLTSSSAAAEATTTAEATATAATRSPPQGTESYTLHITRFTLIDTAEEMEQWSGRAKQKWGDGQPIAIHVSSRSVRRGSTSPAEIACRSGGWTGVLWGSEGGGIDVPLQEDAMVLLEVVVAKHSDTVIGLGVLNAQSLVSEGRQYGKYCVHIAPTQTPMDSQTVLAVAEIEIHSSVLEDVPESNYMPLEYNYGSVRVSTVDFFYPPLLLSGTGEYIVSNVVCAMNMTESSSLAMQLVPRQDAANYVIPEPSQVITVRPQQRVYFTGTWVLSQRACMRPLEMQLTVNGSQRPSAPIIIKVHCSIPQPGVTDIPYHYWANTTRITNRQVLASQELPLIRANLPVYRFLSSGPIDQREGIIVAFDKDKGEQVLVRANGVPVAMGDCGHHLGGWTMGGGGGAAFDLSATGLGDGEHFSDSVFDSNASFVLSDRRAISAIPTRGPMLNLSEKTCLCTIVLGTIRGFPMVHETTSGVSPSFQVSITLLDQRGWQVIHGETLPSYQSASGSLRWSEKLVLRKWPGAFSTQFIRLNLTEVKPRDGLEIPIGAGLVSLSSMNRVHAYNPMSIAFYVHETYSLYDQMNSPSLLMKDVNIIFSEVR